VVPDPPINLAEDVSERTSTNLGLTWSEAAFNGGSAITDYRVKQRVVDGTWSTIAFGVLTTSHTVTGLTLGTIYEFTIEARNSAGYSATSSAF
jgi:hypothetical protein